MEIKTWVDHKRRNSERWEEALLKLFFPRASLKAVSIELWISLRGLCWTQNPGQPEREASPDLQPLSRGFVTWSTKSLSSQPSLAVSLCAVSQLPLLPPTLFPKRKGESFIDATCLENCSAGIHIKESKTLEKCFVSQRNQIGRESLPCSYTHFYEGLACWETNLKNKVTSTHWRKNDIPRRGCS